MGLVSIRNTTSHGKVKMDRPGGGRPKALDIWKHVTEMEGKRVKCKYCGLVFAASANRVKSHVYQIQGNGIRVCTEFPQPINIGSNRIVNSDPKENVIDSNVVLLHLIRKTRKALRVALGKKNRGLRVLIRNKIGFSTRPRDYNKFNNTMLDCYMSPKTMWEGIMALPHAQQINIETKHHERFQFGPFFVSNMLNARDKQLIQYVFDLQLDEWIFSSSRSFLNLSEFTTLKPQTLLDSLVIDIFAEILTDIERRKKITPSNWYLPLTFSSAALSGDVNSFVDFVERQNMRKTYMSDLINCKKMLIPVHKEKNSYGHFYLYIIDLKNQEVQIWDSLCDQFINENEHDVITQKLLLALDELFVDGRRGTNLAFTKFYWRMANNILLQPNEYDCGIFVINYMQQSANFVRRNPLFQYQTDEERLDIALKLLKSDLNKEREILYCKAEERHNAQGGKEQNSDFRGIKRKHVGTCMTLAEDVRGEAYMELDDCHKKVRSTVGLEKGNKIISRSGGRPKADVWKHVTEMEGNQVECNYCGFIFAKSANRIKSHFDPIKRTGIRLCTQFHFHGANNDSNKRVNGDISSSNLGTNLINLEGLKRTGKSCRLSNLHSDVQRGNITLEEQLLILELHSRWSNRWSKIAHHLPGRTENEIKNYWRTKVMKQAEQLKCDVNSKQFKDAMRDLWMPCLLERIRADAPEYDPTCQPTTSASSSATEWFDMTDFFAWTNLDHGGFSPINEREFYPWVVESDLEQANALDSDRGGIENDRLWPYDI